MKLLRFLGRGILHEELAQPCQDRAETFCFENGNTLLALSDGCSSAAHGELGAEGNLQALKSLFEQTTLAELLQEPDEALQKQIIARVLEELNALAEAAEEPLSAYSATLLFAATDGTHTLIGHLGDGVAAAADATGKLSLFSPPENGETRQYTYFTVSAAAEEKLRLYRPEQTSLVFLSSDGPQELLGEAPEQATEALLQAVRAGTVPDHAALSAYLCEQAECMAQRADDWSVLIWDAAGDPCGPCDPEPVSMLTQDRVKYAEQIAAAERLFEGSEFFTPREEQPL